MKVAYKSWRSAASRTVSGLSGGQFERVAVQQVDLHLPHAFFVDQGVDLEALAFAEVVHIVEHRVELVDRVDIERLPAEFGPPGAAYRRLQRHLRIEIGL